MGAMIMGGGALLSGGMNLFGSMNQANASKDAANKQYQAQMAALQQQQQQYMQNRADLEPYRNLGNYAGGQLQNRLTELTSPITMDQATLQQTPGYQFNLNQGLKATQSAAAARGLGVSGAALKGAGTYATGLADNTYQNQFNNAQTNQANAYNRLYGVTSLGENAAAQTANMGQQNANQQSQIYGNMGNAQANGIMGSANALSNGLSGLGGGLNNLTGLYYANQMFNNNGNGGGGGMFGNGK